MQNKSFLFFISMCLSTFVCAQSRWSIGPSAGVCISKTATNDTLANNFTTRNRVGGYFNIVGNFDLNKAAGIHFGVGIINKGYKINNDTLAYNTSINNGFSALTGNLGLSFKQQFSTSNFIMEKFGVCVNYNMFPSTTIDTFNNVDKNTNYRIVQKQINKIYPLFYLGFAMGGITESGNRYEFNLTYQQSFAVSHEMLVQTGEFYSKSFPVNFRGGNLQLGFTYYFNMGNFQKTEEYFY